jgi:hypothetical protein
MGINEIDLTIYPYTVGREDCKVLPRSFKTLAEAEAYLAKQDQRAREHGEFYLDGPEPDNTAPDSCGTPDPKVSLPAPPAAEGGEAHPGCTPMPIESGVTRDAWKREIEELCRALETPEGAR